MAVTDSQRATVMPAVEATIEKIKANIFPTHGI